MTLIYFLLAICLLVVVHEYGHFWAARRCGVKVLRFSVGFGNPFFSVTDKLGTEYSVAPIPLGGYVKMLDEREGDVPLALRHQSFTQKTILQRNFIAAAGPVANFLFTIVVYWLLFLAGTQGLAPVLGAVVPESPASYSGLVAGDEIVQVDGVDTTTWRDVNWELLSYIGESGDIPLTILTESGERRELTVAVNNWLADSEGPDPLEGLGLSRKQVPVPPVIGVIQSGGAAESAGLQRGDVIVSVNGIDIPDWYAMVDVIQQSAKQPLLTVVQRDGNSVSMVMTPGIKVVNGEREIGFAGMGPKSVSYPENWVRTSQPDPFSAFFQALSQTGDLIFLTLDSLWKMIMGDLSVKNLSGPITIAKVAGTSASGGLESFVQFLALLSVSLGVLNLLPVPMLDGGHILLNTVEYFLGKPLPESVQLTALKIGMAILLSLMVVAFYNDISRL